ncbi:receptor-type tyrosine-protein phosphatase mu-like isoform X2 [Physella acuta]|uniref:receptor-type tyrosine-protein phosphatase mu-like isoform X2 n=1 Tax=Physella acuta TaxID=109671 RepID=UPI0027DDCCA2|nr:receptor-type tyrosine-protein phosphatase mu-like isoform X2 [Physella acuta]
MARGVNIAVVIICVQILHVYSACEDGWFGKDCKLQCHCTNNECTDDGTCKNENKCLGEWFGPACQYQNLATVYTATLRQSQTTACNAAVANQKIEVSWNISYPFTFLWVQFKQATNYLTSNLNISITDKNSTCDSIYQSAISQDTVEFRCRTTVNMTRLVLSGGNVKNVCSIYVSGGRNVAVKQSATQDSTLTDFPGRSDASHAVDGNRDSDWNNGFCMHTANQTSKATPHYWTVDFTGETYSVNRYVLYSRWDLKTYPYCCPERISGFTLTSWNNQSDQVFTYTAPAGKHALIHTVVSGSRDVARVNVTLDVDYLNFCEAEIYGVNVCPKNKYGLDCTKECNCVNNEQCHVDTGTCPSGCAPGYTFEGCQTECSAGTWGDDCRNSCSVNCLNTGKCNHTDGTCDGGCVAGFKPPLCTEGCVNGTWGINCSTNCNKNCVNVHCISVNGSCSKGCNKGYKGEQCLTECSPGTWGDDCRNSCSVNCFNKNNCNHIDGTCDGGCVTGFKPPLCTEECDKGTWGSNCSEACNKSCIEDVCNSINGSCLKGCKEGYKGLQCSEKCDSGTWGMECKNNCSVNCLTPNSCSHINGDCIFGCARGYTLANCSLAQTASVTADNDLIIIVAVVVAGVVLVAACIAGVIILYRRRATQRPKTREIDLDKTEEDNSCMPCLDSDENGLSASTTALYEDKNTKQVVDSNNGYYNTVSIQEDTSIPVEELNAFLSTRDKLFLEQQFKNLPAPKDVSTSVGLSELNKHKNRFKNICAYDHSRVHLEINTDENEGDYINACYVEGYKNEERFIASQGPNRVILNDFIRMLWEQKVDKVVMLTNLFEEGKPKCEQYWPDEDEATFGLITVKLTVTDVFADYTIRQFILSKKGHPPHTVKQFHFTSWPDQGVPLTPWALVDFEQRVASQPTATPVVVHCSAGVGRTGTFIALRHVMREAEDTGRVDFFKTLIKLRQARVLMIQTAEQYEFLHKAACVALVCMKTTVASSDIEERIKFLHKKTKSGQSHLQKEFEAVCSLCQNVDDGHKEFDVGDVYQNTSTAVKQQKDRDTKILPHKMYRAQLAKDTANTSDYINAVLIPSFRKNRHQILTQLPLPSTVVDFYRLVTQYRVSLAVAFDGDVQSQDYTIGNYLPVSTTEPLTCEPFVISTSEIKGDNILEEQKLTITRTSQKKETHTMTHVKAAIKKLDPKKLYQIIQKVRSQAYKFNGRILFMCSDGAEWSGLASVLTLLLDRMDHDQRLTVPLVVGAIKSVRPEVISSLSQYEVLYKVLERYHEVTSSYNNVGDVRIVPIIQTSEKGPHEDSVYANNDVTSAV